MKDQRIVRRSTLSNINIFKSLLVETIATETIDGFKMCIRDRLQTREYIDQKTLKIISKTATEAFIRGKDVFRRKERIS